MGQNTIDIAMVRKDEGVRRESIGAGSDGPSMAKGHKGRKFKKWRTMLTVKFGE